MWDTTLPGTPPSLVVTPPHTCDPFLTIWLDAIPEKKGARATGNSLSAPLSLSVSCNFLKATGGTHQGPAEPCAHHQRLVLPGRQQAISIKRSPGGAQWRPLRLLAPRSMSGSPAAELRHAPGHPAPPQPNAVLPPSRCLDSLPSSLLKLGRAPGSQCLKFISRPEGCFRSLVLLTNVPAFKTRPG